MGLKEYSPVIFVYALLDSDHRLIHFFLFPIIRYLKTVNEIMIEHTHITNIMIYDSFSNSIN